MKQFLTYKQAKALCRKKKIKDSIEYKKFRKGTKLPSEPYYYYKGWINWYDFLGTQHPSKRVFLKYKLAVKWNKKNKIMTSGEYAKKRIRSLPAIPSNYPEWKGWGEYLGTHAISTTNRNFVSCAEASRYVIKNGIRSLQELRLWSKQGKKPANIPAIPQVVYKDNGWKGSKKFFNTEFVSYNKAKEILKKYNIKNSVEFLRFIKENNNYDSTSSL